MKRFIDLRGQIIDPFEEEEEEKRRPHFAFYCTVVDEFEEFAGYQEWNSIEGFRSAFFEEYGNLDVEEEFQRYRGLMPDWVPEKSEPL